MFNRKRARIQKRSELLPGQSAGTRNWDVGSVQMAWDVEPQGPDFKSMARIMVQDVRLHAPQPDSRNVHPDRVFAGQTR
jgi:hypothetical protein